MQARPNKRQPAKKYAVNEAARWTAGSCRTEDRRLDMDVSFNDDQRSLVATSQPPPHKLLPELDPKVLAGMEVHGFEDENTRKTMEIRYLLQRSKMVTLKPLLPLLFTIRGYPYSLNRSHDDKGRIRSAGYYPFETFFRTRVARRTVLKTGRQLSKSTSLATRGIVMAACVPFFSTMYITPQFELVRRFSQNYVRPFIDESPVKGLFTNTHEVASVMQRTLPNKSMMLFSFAFLSPDRCRGPATDSNNFDEIQDMDESFLPVINESLSNSRWALETYAGTPKSLENCIEGRWQDSSQGEWCVKCHHCNYWNVPALSHDLDAMIGPYRDDISFENPGVICASCRKPILPQNGRWIHARPEKRWSFAGYHVPQIIMPVHYADREKWAALVAKRAGAGNTPVNVFYNEVCGESYDTGSRLVTMTELQAAAILPWHNTLDEAKPQIRNYVHRVLAVDWGGGGEDGVSFTVMTVLGMRADGRIDVLWGYRSLTPHEHEREARLVLAAIQHFQCHALAHDYTGAGSLRETFVVQAGYPLDRIINCAYNRAASSSRIMEYRPGTKMVPRSHYRVDKARSLLLTCNQIKNGWLRFFQWDYVDKTNAGLIYDFIALVDEKVDSRIGKDVYTIIRDPSMRDDFAQAVNIGCCTLWHMSDRWPDIAAVAALRLDPRTEAAIQPIDYANALDAMRDTEGSF